LEQFDVEERSMDLMTTSCPNVKVIQRTITSLNTEKHVSIIENCLVKQYHLKTQKINVYS